MALRCSLEITIRVVHKWLHAFLLRWFDPTLIITLFITKALLLLSKKSYPPVTSFMDDPTLEIAGHLVYFYESQMLCFGNGVVFTYNLGFDVCFIKKTSTTDGTFFLFICLVSFRYYKVCQFRVLKSKFWNLLTNKCEFICNWDNRPKFFKEIFSFSFSNFNYLGVIFDRARFWALLNQKNLNLEKIRKIIENKIFLPSFF